MVEHVEAARKRLEAHQEGELMGFLDVLEPVGELPMSASRRAEEAKLRDGGGLSTGRTCSERLISVNLLIRINRKDHGGSGYL
jgi:hypothetical protein